MDLECLKKANQEFLWEFPELDLKDVLHNWTEAGTKLLDYKKFKEILDKISAESDNKLNKTHYEEFLRALFEINEFDRLKGMFIENL